MCVVDLKVLWCLAKTKESAANQQAQTGGLELDPRPRPRAFAATGD